MSNTKHTNGQVPAAFAKQVPPSADVAEQTLAQVIGESVALHLAQLLPQVMQVMQELPFQPSCFFCVTAAKTMVRAYQVAVKNAEQAGDDVPKPPPAPGVAKGITWVPVTQLVQTPAGPVPGTSSVPACWDHVQAQGEAPRPTGLVAPDGRPIVHTGG